MSSESRTNPGPQQKSIDPSTTAVLAGRGGVYEGDSALAPTVVNATTWRSASFADAAHDAGQIRPRRFYGRFSNPTVRAFERAVAELEHAQDALAFGSGMGAVATTVLALCSSGSHIVATQQLYSGTIAFLNGPCQRFGIDVTFVDGTVPGAMEQAVEAGRTTLVIAESPSNPVIEIVDLDELGSIVGPFTMIDSTLATPMAQTPIDHGVDIVMHSGTKGIGGHNDATLGVVAAEAELIDAIWAYSVLHGATASPSDAAYALRGIRTMAVRTGRQSDTALAIAAWLQRHRSIAAVHYPGLPDHRQHALAARQMRQFGGVLSFELTGGRPAVEKLLDGLSAISLATSMGGTETLVCHPATTTAASLSEDDQAALGISPGLVRMSVGLEHPDDLIGELDALLENG